MIVAGFSAYSRVPRLQEIPRDRRFGRRLSVRRHGARRGPRGRGPVSGSDSARRRRHDDDAQDAARSARRPDPRARERRDHQEAQLAGVPRHAGRPAHARDRREGRGVPRSAAAGVQGIPEAGRRERARDGGALCRSATTRSCPAAPTTTCSCSTSRTSEITGKEADAALGKAHITVNKNAVPNDPRPPMVTSGIRIGTPAGTTRGFKEARVRADRGLDRGRARCERQRRGDRDGARRGRRAVPPLPGLWSLRTGRLTRGH